MVFGAMLDDILRAARTAATIVPAAGQLESTIAIGEKLIEIIDQLTDHIPDARTQAEMQEARSKLAAAVSSKAERTADRFD